MTSFGSETEISLASDSLFRVEVSLSSCCEGGKEEKVSVLDEAERVGDWGAVGAGVGPDVLPRTRPSQPSRMM